MLTVSLYHIHDMDGATGDKSTLCCVVSIEHTCGVEKPLILRQLIAHPGPCRLLKYLSAQYWYSPPLGWRWGSILLDATIFCARNMRNMKNILGNFALCMAVTFDTRSADPHEMLELNTHYSSPSILQPSILRPPLVIRPLDLVAKGNFLC